MGKSGLTVFNLPIYKVLLTAPAKQGRKVRSHRHINNIPLIHENADANITCDFGDGDFNRFRSRLPHGHIVSSIIVRYNMGVLSFFGRVLPGECSLKEVSRDVSPAQSLHLFAMSRSTI